MIIKKLDILSIDFDWILNLRQQEDLLSFVIPIINSHDNITMELSHDKIYPLFEHGFDEYNIFNIDHHHDYFYNLKDMKEKFKELKKFIEYLLIHGIEEINKMFIHKFISIFLSPFPTTTLFCFNNFINCIYFILLYNFFFYFFRKFR